jgi:hypothetical protein
LDSNLLLPREPRRPRPPLSVLRFWLHASTVIPNALQYAAMREPIRPNPIKPTVLPSSIEPASVPT